MADTNKIYAWWKKQNNAIKAVIIAGFFSLLVVPCSCCAEIAVAQVNNIFNNQKPSTVQYHLTRNNSYTMDPLLFTTIQGKIYGTDPGNCVVADYGGSSLKFDEPKTKTNIQTSVYAFYLITDTTTILSDVLIKISAFSSPPNENGVDIIMLFDEPGMGGVPVIHFPQATINKSTKQIILRRTEGALRLDPGDAVTIYIPLVFADPGRYDFNFVAEGQLVAGRKVEFKSDTYSFGWMTINNITAKLIESSFKLASMKWLGDCP